MLRHFIAPLFWSCIILFLSSIPASDIPSFDLWDLVKSDKIGHVIMYGVLSFQLMRGCVRQYKSWKLRYNATTFALTVTVCYGGVIELYQQYFLTDRYGDWVDMAANVVGAILGVVVFRIIFSEYIR